MFIHKTQLRQLLTPDQYVSEAQYRDELEHLFRPAWHLVATTHDLARPGDFVSLELLGRPVLVRNMDGELKAFLNVCPHRHSRLTSVARGSSARLKCQYHGWEFNAEGRTARIPDAQCFRPFDRENACLVPFRVATCGALVFVSLADDGPSLEEFLGPVHDAWLESFGPRYRFAGGWERDFACNWKVVVENSLESYHIPSVHPKTFKRFPREEFCEHVLDGRYTTFRSHRRGRGGRPLRRWATRTLGGPVGCGYEHQNIHPHLTLSSLDVARLAMIAYPTSPTTCRYRVFAFSLANGRGGPVGAVLSRILRRVVLKVARKVYLEDASIYAAVQQGLAASPHPGVIGTREERVHVFQDYVRRHCRGAAERSGEEAPGVELPLAE